ncbi:MAG: Spy/CpxP family protein refolding chaperone [Ignavibacteria bacterium]|nr:Spy/CpxP family protein refolding chaperone [Ignavibacteria bacterium]
MKSKLLVFATILTALLISGNLFSQEYRQENRVRDGMKNKDRIQEKLNLSDEQTDKIEELKLNHKNEMIGLVAEIEKKEVELEQLKSSINFSREAYLNKINEIISEKNKLEITKANHQMDIYQLLDDNQKQEWNKMTRIMHERKHKVVRKMRDRDFD